MPLLNWLWPISSGACDASARIAIKKTDAHGLVLNWIGLLIGFPVFLVWLWIVGMPEIKPQFWNAVIWHVPMYVAILICTVEAHRAGTMLKTMPFASLTPVFLLITSPMMGGGNPTFWGAIGIAITVVGLYSLNIERGQKNIFVPLKLIFTELAAQFMFGATLIAALSANLDKTAILNSSPAFYLLIDHTAVAFILIALIFLRLAISGQLTYKNSRSEIVTVGYSDVKKQIFSLKEYNAFVWYGLFNVFTGLFHSIGLTFLPHVPYFITGKRVGAIIFALIFGLSMWYWERVGNIDPSKRRFSREADNLSWRLAGTFLVVVGMSIVILYGKAESAL